MTGKEFSTAVGRWSGLGPYYAMFPIDFAFDVVRRHSNPGDNILDPFAGRGTSIYAAAMQGRTGIGIEINPVGWLYGSVKLYPASEANVLRRLGEIVLLSASDETIKVQAMSMPAFFAHCYATETLEFLLTARRELKWQTSKVDATLMALLLVYLHGKADGSLSNQMRQGKAMAPDYSVRWWTERDMKPPTVDILGFLTPRIRWRYRKGIRKTTGSKMILGNSLTVLPKGRGLAQKQSQLLFTSPPYYSITNYHYDQWLRLWMLGGAERPAGGKGEWRGKFDSQVEYARLIREVFTASKQHLAEDAIIYVRTDAREFTLKTTKTILKELFPGKSLAEIDRPMLRRSQTPLFGDKTEKPGEVDLILA